jgi:hypothetical protein
MLISAYPDLPHEVLELVDGRAVKGTRQEWAKMEGGEKQKSHLIQTRILHRSAQFGRMTGQVRILALFLLAPYASASPRSCAF